MKRIISLMLLLVLSFTLVGCVDQAQGENIETKEEVRIAATSIAVCEILDALEVEEVVGIPESQSYSVPERYREATSLGSAMSPDMEILKTLDPTVVISPISLESDLKSQYEGIGVSYNFVNLSSVNGMFASIQELGETLGKEEQASVLVNEFETYIDEYKKKHEGEEAPTVLILMGLPGSYVVATENSYVGNLVSLAGGTNVYAGESDEDFINVNTEDMLQRNPDIILRTSHAMPEQVKAMFASEFEENDIWKHFSAVENNQVFDLDSELFGMSANFSYQSALEHLETLFYSNDAD